MATGLKNDWRVIGHEQLLRQLEQELEADNLSHAMLLTGPAEIGKMTILKRLAQLLQSGGSPDSKIYKEIENESHLDTMFIHDEGGKLKIAEIREIKKHMGLSRQGDYKVAIIQNVERLTVPAANSLLKVLEEPPERAIFMLTSSRPADVLPTILSRCRVYRASGKSDLSEFSEELIKLSGGRIGRLMKLKDDEGSEKLKDWLGMIENMDDDNVSLLALAEQLNELDRSEVLDFLKLMLEWARREMDLKKIEEIQKTINLVSQNVNTRLALEVLFLQCFSNLGRV